MVQAVSRRPLTAEARVRSRVGPCGIFGGLAQVFPVFHCQFHSTGAPSKWKTEKTSSSQGCTVSLQGCGVSLASATGPFN
jgi:hypothetical protein